jgi:hypothetical protein
MRQWRYVKVGENPSIYFLLFRFRFNTVEGRSSRTLRIRNRRRISVRLGRIQSIIAHFLAHLILRLLLFTLKTITKVFFARALIDPSLPLLGIVIGFCPQIASFTGYRTSSRLRFRTVRGKIEHVVVENGDTTVLLGSGSGSRTRWIPSRIRFRRRIVLCGRQLRPAFQTKQKRE